jgi:glycosyltransferase involved in cell wall biosynthesis
MKLNLVNIVDNVGPVNFGIWNASISQWDELSCQHNILSYLLFPKGQSLPSELQALNAFELERDAIRTFQRLAAKFNWTPQNTLVATHGCWRLPTKVGHALRQKGYRWLYCPHGMLEPWPLRQKYIRKRIALALWEKPMAMQADCIRAVSMPERENLFFLFENHENIVHLPNSIPQAFFDGRIAKPSTTCNFTFLGRLHHKKSPYETALAFSSLLPKPSSCQLVLAGPDQGEAKRIRELAATSNQDIQVPGPVFGDSKRALLQRTHFFILASKSEGMPTSVIEAMACGCIPIVTRECNLPELLDHELAIEVRSTVDSIQAGLRAAITLPRLERERLAKANSAFASSKYSSSVVAADYATLIKTILEI